MHGQHGYACPRGTNNPTLCKLMSTLYTGDIPSLFKLSTLANTVSLILATSHSCSLLGAVNIGM